MVDLTTGVYGPPLVGKVPERQASATAGQPFAPPHARDLLAQDAVKVASISDVAGRTSTYRSALRSLEDIHGYLNDLL